MDNNSNNNYRNFHKDITAEALKRLKQELRDSIDKIDLKIDEENRWNIEGSDYIQVDSNLNNGITTFKIQVKLDKLQKDISDYCAEQMITYKLKQEDLQFYQTVPYNSFARKYCQIQLIGNANEENNGLYSYTRDDFTTSSNFPRYEYNMIKVVNGQQNLYKIFVEKGADDGMVKFTTSKVENIVTQLTSAIVTSNGSQKYTVPSTWRDDYPYEED